MTDPEIPGAAVEAADIYSGQLSEQHLRQMLTRAAPHIVAANLRVLADEIGRTDYGRVAAQVMYQRADRLAGDSPDA